jgi:hypothetical protein
MLLDLFDKLHMSACIRYIEAKVDCGTSRCYYLIKYFENKPKCKKKYLF